MKQRKISRRKVHAIKVHFCEDIPASKTADLVRLNRNTVNAWYMYFRLAIFWWRTKRRHELVGGEVEVDESYHGSKRKRGFHGKLKRGRGTNKQPVFGIFEREGEVLTELVPNCKKKTLQGLILGRVSTDTVVYSDGWRGYNGLVDVGYDKHYRVNHGQNEFSKGNGVHINGIESFWSFTKRRFRKFNGLAAHTFDLHLKECEWRWKKKPAELLQELDAILRRYDKL